VLQLDEYEESHVEIAHDPYFWHRSSRPFGATVTSAALSEATAEQLRALTLVVFDVHLSWGVTRPWWTSPIVFGHEVDRNLLRSSRASQAGVLRHAIAHGRPWPLEPVRIVGSWTCRRPMTVVGNDGVRLYLRLVKAASVTLAVTGDLDRLAERIERTEELPAHERADLLARLNTRSR